jgi:hypothetical protein
VVKGTACVVKDNEAILLTENQLKGEVEPSPLKGLICDDLNYVFEAVITVMLCINNK